MKETLRRYWKWILVGVAVLFLIVQYGGVTVVVVNRVYIPICEVHISASTEVANWGPNRIRSRIPSPQSRDIRLPIYMNWFHPSGQRSLNVWAVDCQGDIIDSISYVGENKSLYLWEVTGTKP